MQRIIDLMEIAARGFLASTGASSRMSSMLGSDPRDGRNPVEEKENVFCVSFFCAGKNYFSATGEQRKGPLLRKRHRKSEETSAPPQRSSRRSCCSFFRRRRSTLRTPVKCIWHLDCRKRDMSVAENRGDICVRLTTCDFDILCRGGMEALRFFFALHFLSERLCEGENK